jgi:hypothetical protein
MAAQHPGPPTRTTTTGSHMTEQAELLAFYELTRAKAKDDSVVIEDGIDFSDMEQTHVEKLQALHPALEGIAGTV